MRTLTTEETAAVQKLAAHCDRNGLVFADVLWNLRAALGMADPAEIEDVARGAGRALGDRLGEAVSREFVNLLGGGSRVGRSRRGRR